MEQPIPGAAVFPRFPFMSYVFREMFDQQIRAVTENTSPLDHMSHLPDITGPRIVGKNLHCPVGNTVNPPGMLFAEEHQKMIDQQWQALLPLPQWR